MYVFLRRAAFEREPGRWRAIRLLDRLFANDSVLVLVEPENHCEMISLKGANLNFSERGRSIKDFSSRNVKKVRLRINSSSRRPFKRSRNSLHPNKEVGENNETLTLGMLTIL